MEAVIGRPAEAAAVRATLLVRLGILLGLIMPVLNAALHPTYMHQMQPAWAEWTRLVELPFVACELVVVHLAIWAGYDDGTVWRMLPRDVHFALGVLLAGLTVSSVLVSRNPAASVALSLITLVRLRFAATMFFLSGRERSPDVDALFRWLGAGLAVLAGLTALKFVFAPPASLVPGGRIERPAAVPGFISVRHLGSWSDAVAAGLMVALLYGRRDRMTALLYLLAAGITCWSGTRAAVLAMGVAGLVTLVTLRRWPERGALALVAVLSVAALAAGIALAPPGLSEFSLFARDNLGSADAMTSGRLELWRQTFARWQDAPVFGWGSGLTFWEVYVG